MIETLICAVGPLCVRLCVCLILVVLYFYSISLAAGHSNMKICLQMKRGHTECTSDTNGIWYSKDHWCHNVGPSVHLALTDHDDHDDHEDHDGNNKYSAHRMRIDPRDREREKWSAVFLTSVLYTNVQYGTLLLFYKVNSNFSIFLLAPHQMRCFAFDLSLSAIYVFCIGRCDSSNCFEIGLHFADRKQ